MFHNTMFGWTSLMIAFKYLCMYFVCMFVCMHARCTCVRMYVHLGMYVRNSTSMYILYLYVPFSQPLYMYSPYTAREDYQTHPVPFSFINDPLDMAVCVCLPADHWRGLRHEPLNPGEGAVPLQANPPQTKVLGLTTYGVRSMFYYYNIFLQRIHSKIWLTTPIHSIANCWYNQIWS